MALEFLTGYVVEKSLSLDNIFVFVIVFSHFRVPLQYHHRVLFHGILGAMVFRAIFIVIGSALLQYAWTAIVFGGFLVLTGIRMIAVPDREMQPEENVLVRMLRRMAPVTSDFDGPRFLTRSQGRLHATPLLLTLAVVEASDILFAIDSVPGDFRHHRRAADRIYVERICHPRLAFHVFSACRSRREVLLIALRPGACLGLSRIEDGVAQLALARSIPDRDVAWSDCRPRRTFSWVCRAGFSQEDRRASPVRRPDLKALKMHGAARSRAGDTDPSPVEGCDE